MKINRLLVSQESEFSGDMCVRSKAERCSGIVILQVCELEDLTVTNVNA